MAKIKFEEYVYYPTLRTRSAELKGLKELDLDRKRRIAPLLTLGRWPKSTEFSKSAEKANEAMDGLPHFIDLTTDANHLGDQQKKLRDSENGFQAWRDFVGQYENAIPVAQILAGARARDFIRQAQELERKSGQLAFRIRDFSTDTQMVINALSALDNPGNALVFIDCQYIRNALSAYVAATVATINQLRTEFPEIVIAVISTSFPASTASFADATQQRGSIDIQERELHTKIGGSTVAVYGDHASIHSIVYDSAPIMRWVPRVDYPRELVWYFERRPGEQGGVGYVNAAAAVVDSDPSIGTRNIWGEGIIIESKNGSAFAKAPGPWISVRVNIHLARQLDFSTKLANPDNDEEEDSAGESD